MAKERPNVFDHTGYVNESDLAHYRLELEVETDPKRRNRLEAILSFHQHKHDGSRSPAHFDFLMLRKACENVIAAVNESALVDWGEVITIVDSAANILMRSRENWLDTQTPEYANADELRISGEIVQMEHELPPQMQVDDATDTLRGELRFQAETSVFYSLTAIAKALETNDIDELPE